MKKITLNLSVISMFFLGIFVQAQSDIQTGKDVAVTDTELGKVRGYVHNGIYTYKGIEYAKAQRFEAAVKPDGWDGVRSSATYGPVAPLLTPTTSVEDDRICF